MPGRLILLSSPIGNLSDAPPRLAEALAACDVVYAEDTRRSRILLDALGVRAPLRSYFAGNEAERSKELAARLEGGATVGLLTDAGTPAISDPGYSAVRAALAAEADVTMVPGPSAVTAALAISGLPAERFVFEGFLPRKGELRRSRIAGLVAEERTAVFFSTKSRLAADLGDLAAALGESRPVAVTWELTKLHEQVWRGILGEAATHWAEHQSRGEVTVVLGGAGPVEEDLGAAVAAVEARVAEGVPFAQAVRAVAEETGTRRRRLYEAALRK